MPTKTSAFLQGRTGSILGMSLGSGGTYPTSAMVFNGVASPLSGNDLTNYTQNKAMLGVPTIGVVRLYNNNADATSGTTGSNGAYGLISSDWRSIANDGAILAVTFKYGTAGTAINTWASQWGFHAAELNAAGTNPTKTSMANIAQNIRRWVVDTGNTAPIKKLVFGFWHEPSNDGGVAADYVAFYRAIHDALLNNGIGGGPKPLTGPGSTYSGQWQDAVEWMWVDVAANIANGYYPGDAYVTHAWGDTYNWGGGQVSNAAANAGQVPQVGATGFAGTHYGDNWRSVAAACQNVVNWYKAGPGGARDVYLGLGELASSEDIDRFTVSGDTLVNPPTNTGKPHMKGDWYAGLPNYVKGAGYTATNNPNSFPAEPLGPLFKMICLWPSQQAGPRWWNTKPFNPGDTTTPTTTGTAPGSAAYYTFDKVVAVFNDPIFLGTGAVVVGPSAATISNAPTDGVDYSIDFVGTVTVGDNPITTYAWAWGDGSGTTTHTSSATTDLATHVFPGAGPYTVTLTVTDSAAKVATKSKAVTPTLAAGGGGGGPVGGTWTGGDGVTTDILSNAPLIQPGDPPPDLRFTYNPAIVQSSRFTSVRALHFGLLTAIESWASQPAAVTAFGTANRIWHVDAAGFTTVKLTVTVGTAATTGAKLAAYYSVDGGATWRAFSGTVSGPAVTTSLVGCICDADTVGAHHSAYVTMPTEALVDDLLIRLYGAGGNGATSPAYSAIGLRLR